MTVVAAMPRAAEFLATLRPTTSKNYGGAIRSWREFGGSPPNEITAIELERFRAHLIDRGQAQSTANLALYGIRSYLRWLKDKGELRSSLRFTRPRAPSRERALRLSEAETFLENLEGSGRLWRRDQALFELILRTGIRGTEAVALQVGDIDLKTGWVRVGGSNPRRVPLQARHRASLRSYLGWRELVFGMSFGSGVVTALFPTTAGQALDHGSAARLLRKHGATFTMSDLRKCFAARATATGAPFAVVHRVLGFKQASRTAKFCPAPKATAVAGLARLLDADDQSRLSYRNA